MEKAEVLRACFAFVLVKTLGKVFVALESMSRRDGQEGGAVGVVSPDLRKKKDMLDQSYGLL